MYLVIIRLVFLILCLVFFCFFGSSLFCASMGRFLVVVVILFVFFVILHLSFPVLCLIFSCFVSHLGSFVCLSAALMKF